MQAYLPGAGWIDFDPTNSIIGNRNPYLEWRLRGVPSMRCRCGAPMRVPREPSSEWMLPWMSPKWKGRHSLRNVRRYRFHAQDADNSCSARSQSSSAEPSGQPRDSHRA